MEKVRFVGLKVLYGSLERYKGVKSLFDVPMRAIGTMNEEKSMIDVPIRAIGTMKGRKKLD
ncbi:hypothetical protein V7654_09265 [Bacillus sp. JJ1609]|uniref:hypothetical protein n=1 Tax=Bacillus sp. JJ1609 TaxID=3122977 RepID=UPI002FFF0CC0